MEFMSDTKVPLYNLDEIPVLNPRDGVVQRVFRGSGVCVSFAELHPDMKPSPHSHPWEQIFMLLRGKVKLHVGDQVFDMRDGSFVRIPPNVVHYSEPPLPEDGMALNLDIFSPLRPDFFALTAYQTDDFGTSTPAPLQATAEAAE
jgi:mannose-6-phosphate isomerase-like protein (cupin superfamily)